MLLLMILIMIIIIIIEGMRIRAWGEGIKTTTLLKERCCSMPEGKPMRL